MKGVNLTFCVNCFVANNLVLKLHHFYNLTVNFLSHLK